MNQVFNDFKKYITDQSFPCIAARSAVNSDKISLMEAGHMACPHDDARILGFLYQFIASYRKNADALSSAVVIFNGPDQINENIFEMFLWKRLQALHDLDRSHYTYDSRVSPDPQSAEFSFSIGQEAFFIIGMHPASSRPARAFSHPAIVFNPHQQFEDLKKDGRYEKIKAVVRQRELRTNGTINPMLADFGARPETFQYSGKSYEAGWTCPLHTRHD